MGFNESCKYIRENVPRRELLAQLAEECAELGQAALKLRRAEDTINPTPVNWGDAYDLLVEEIADVTLCLGILGMDDKVLISKYGEVQNAKADRWADRIGKNKRKLSGAV